MGCARTVPHAGGAKIDTRVSFFDRTVDLRPHLAGYPYGQFLPAWGRAEWVYLEAREGGSRLLTVPLADASPDLTAGTSISDLDWSTRTLWNLSEAPGETLTFIGDERNDERLNLYRLDPDGGDLLALTDEPYLYGSALSPDRTTWAVIVRRGQGPYQSCLETLNMDGSDPVVVLCDTPELSLTWGEPAWAPDGRGVVVRVNRHGRRDHGNLAWVSFDRPIFTVLTDSIAERAMARTVSPWLDPYRFLTLTTEEGIAHLSRWNLHTGASARLYTFKGEAIDARIVEELVVLLERRTEGDRLFTLDPSDGETLGEIQIPGRGTIHGEPHGRKLALGVTSGNTPSAVHRVEIDPSGGLEAHPWIEVPPELGLVHCDVRAVRFPTHDTDPLTGTTRELTGYLYTPRRPLPTPAARVTAFYGGSNRFDTATQLFCEAGIATLSPAVRGSHGFGEAFSRLNDGDLGGDEIADLFAAGRWLETQGYSRGRIGLHGGSHGGYATQRALTFPPGTNHHESVYPFAFGLSRAGFSDILTFHAACNIPDWVVTEAGDPTTEADRLHDRSPLTHVARLEAPLFLIHGENDSRVPVAESRQMAEACAAAGKPCTYVEVPDQGHRVTGLENRVAAYRAMLTFLETALSTP